MCTGISSRFRSCRVLVDDISPLESFLWTLSATVPPPILISRIPSVHRGQIPLWRLGGLLCSPPRLSGNLGRHGTSKQLPVPCDLWTACLRQMSAFITTSQKSRRLVLVRDVCRSSSKACASLAVGEMEVAIIISCARDEGSLPTPQPTGRQSISRSQVDRHLGHLMRQQRISWLITVRPRKLSKLQTTKEPLLMPLLPSRRYPASQARSAATRGSGPCSGPQRRRSTMRPIRPSRGAPA